MTVTNITRSLSWRGAASSTWSRSALWLPDASGEEDQPADLVQRAASPEPRIPAPSGRSQRPRTRSGVRISIVAEYREDLGEGRPFHRVPRGQNALRVTWQARDRVVAELDHGSGWGPHALRFAWDHSRICFNPSTKVGRPTGSRRQGAWMIFRPGNLELDRLRWGQGRVPCPSRARFFGPTGQANSPPLGPACYRRARPGGCLAARKLCGERRVWRQSDSARRRPVAAISSITCLVGAATCG